MEATKPSYEQLEQLNADLTNKLAETVTAAEADARAEFLRGQEYARSLPSPPAAE